MNDTRTAPIFRLTTRQKHRTYSSVRISPATRLIFQHVIHATAYIITLNIFFSPGTVLYDTRLNCPQLSRIRLILMSKNSGLGVLLKSDAISKPFRDEVQSALVEIAQPPKLVGILSTSSKPSRFYAEFTKVWASSTTETSVNVTI